MLDDCRSLIYPETMTLPVIIRCCKKYLNRLKLISRLHLSNVKIRNLWTYAYFFSPYIIIFSFVFKDSSIKWKCFKWEYIIICSLHFSSLYPFIIYRIITLTLKHIWTNIPNIFCFSCRKIDIPLSEKIMKLRSPYMFAHNSTLMLFPYYNFLRIFKTVKSFWASECDTVITWNRCRKIIPAILFAYKWICSLQYPRFIVLKFFVFCHLFSPFPLFLFLILPFTKVF